VLAWLTTVVVVPMVSLGADSLLHSWLNRINAHMLGIGALAFTLVSAMFHWHIMQNGAMLVGDRSVSLWTDMKRMPKLLLSFAVTFVPSQRSGNTTNGAEEGELEMAA
jgi:hypothetical protein